MCRKRILLFFIVEHFLLGSIDTFGFIGIIAVLMQNTAEKEQNNDLRESR